MKYRDVQPGAFSHEQCVTTVRCAIREAGSAGLSIDELTAALAYCSSIRPIDIAAYAASSCSAVVLHNGRYYSHRYAPEES